MSLFHDFAGAPASKLASALGSVAPPGGDARGFCPSAPELWVLERLRAAGSPVSLTWPSMDADARPRAIDPDDDTVVQWLRSNLGQMEGPEHTAAAYRLVEHKVQLRLLNRRLGDTEDERKARSAVRRLAKKLGADADALLVVPAWHDEVGRSQSRRKLARSCARGAPSEHVVERLLAARGLLDTANKLSNDPVPASLAEVTPALEQLCSDSVGYVRLLALMAAERLVLKARHYDAPAAAEPLVQLLSDAPALPDG